MAIKTYINGSANGTITFKGDTEPCAVYVNGERQDNISYIPQEVKGENSVLYKSEYKKNIRTLSIEGNTYQKTEESSPIIEQAISSSDFTSTGSNFIAYYITTEQLTVLQEWATDKGYTGNFVLSVSAENTSAIPTGFAVIVGNSLDDVLVGSNTTTIYYKSDIESKDTVTVNRSNTVYIGIGNTLDGVGENASEYLNLFLSNFTLLLQPTEYKGIPSPENPSAVKDLNDNGVSIALQGINLLDKSKFPATQTINGVTFTNNGDGTITANGTATANAIFPAISLANPISIVSGHKFLFISCPPGGSFSTYYSDSKKVPEDESSYDFGAGVIMTTASTTTGLRCNIRVVSGYTANNLVFKPQLYDLTAIYGEGNEPTTVEQFLKDYPDYEPYFNKTVQIPSSVTLSGGASLSINLAKVGDKADKLSVKGSRAIYSQSTEKITLTGEESGWSEAEGVYKYSLGKALIANVGYCTYFKLSSNGEENTFGVESDGITFKTDVATGLESFKAWLKAKSDAGNAVTVTVALASPVEYDITDTEAGQNILALSAYTKNLTNIIEVTPNDTANPDVSSITVSYAKWGANLNN